MKNKSGFEHLMDRAFNEAVRMTVQDMIEDHPGSGIDSEVKQAIRKEADRLVKDDPAIKQAIKEKLLYWISEQ